MVSIDSSWLKRLPDALMVLVVILHLWPLATGQWLVTLDGPCHLYNARLLLEVLSDSPASEFFRLNHRIEPNLLGYLLLGVFQLALPAWLSMHLLYAVIIVGTALAFRALARTLAPDDPWTCLLGLPFLLTYPLVMGFFNYGLGIAVLLLAMAVWERRISSRNQSMWPMLVIVGLLYLAHLTAFLVGATWLIARTAWACWHDEEGMRARWRTMATTLSAALVLPVLLVLWYFMRMEPKEGAAFRFETSELLRWVTDGRAWITFSYDEDLPWTRAMAFVLLVLGLIAIARSAMRRNRRVLPWLFASLGLFILYLILPDVLAGGSLNSPRMLLFTMFFLAIGVVASRLPKAISTSVTLALAFASMGHLNSFMRAERALQAEARDLLTLAPRLSDGAVVLPLNYSDNWLHSNLSNLLGAETGAVLLDHFVAQAPFAPVQWRPERLPYSIGDFDRSNRPCVRIDDYRDAESPLVTHVLAYRAPEQPTDSCSVAVSAQLENGFVRVAETIGGAVLYRRR